VVQRNKLSTGDRLISVSSIALLIFMVLPWFGFEKEFNQHGWNYPLYGVVPTVLGLAMLALLIAGSVTNSERASSWAPAYLVAGFVAAVLILAKLIIGGKVDSIVGSVSLHPKPGIYLALVAALGLAGGGILKLTESRATRRAPG
jgi:hypothetical protein